MTKQMYEIEWDGKTLGPTWFTVESLALCLYSGKHTERELLSIREVKNSWERKLAKIAIVLSASVLVITLLMLAFFVMVMSGIAVMDVSQAMGG